MSGGLLAGFCFHGRQESINEGVSSVVLTPEFMVLEESPATRTVRPMLWSGERMRLAWYIPMSPSLV